MAKYKQFDIDIDKLTHSIENAFSGDSFKTIVLELSVIDIRSKNLTGFLIGKLRQKQLIKGFISL